LHVHVSALGALIFTAYLLIIGFLLRSAAIVLADKPLGKAISFIY